MPRPRSALPRISTWLGPPLTPRVRLALVFLVGLFLGACGGQQAEGPVAAMMKPEHVVMVSLFDGGSGAFYSISAADGQPTVVVHTMSAEQIPGDDLPPQVDIDQAVFAELRDRALELSSSYAFDPGMEGDPAAYSNLIILFGAPGLTSLTLDMAFASEDPAFRGLRDAVVAAVGDAGR